MNIKLEIEQEQKEYEKVLAYMKSLIAEGKLIVGSRIPAERDISQQLQISRNSTREALKILESNGILESRRGSGNYLVCNIAKSFTESLDMMLLLQKTNEMEICSFRKYMEQVACEMIFANRQDQSQLVEELNKLLQKMKKKNQTELDRTFHYRLIAATENHLLITIMEMLIPRYRSCIDEILDRVTEEEQIGLQNCHEQICQAIAAGNKETCIQAINKHYDLLDKYLG